MGNENSDAGYINCSGGAYLVGELQVRNPCFNAKFLPHAVKCFLLTG